MYSKPASESLSVNSLTQGRSTTNKSLLNPRFGFFIADTRMALTRGSHHHLRSHSTTGIDRSQSL
jgi:hypothetical protein